MPYIGETDLSGYADVPKYTWPKLPGNSHEEIADAAASIGDAGAHTIFAAKQPGMLARTKERGVVKIKQLAQTVEGLFPSKKKHSLIPNSRVIGARG